MKNKNKKYIRASVEIFFALLFAVLIFNIGIFSFISYLIAFFSALKRNLFLRKNKMALKLFFGTLLIYFATLLLPFIFTTLQSGDLFGGLLLLSFAVFLWFKGRNTRK